MGIIECKNVCKSFGEKVALDDVSVSIPKGQIFGLLGPNGAGKTTLIRIINRITIPNGGQVLFDGHPITQDDVERIGYLPEERGPDDQETAQQDEQRVLRQSDEHMV